MKKFVLIIVFIISGLLNVTAQKQDYDQYLQNAYKHLEDGNIESAKKVYSVYKQLTGKAVVVFEELFKKTEVDWKQSCYTINLGDGYELAIQKIDADQRPLSWTNANATCAAQRLGAFNDWRLPTKEEMQIIFANINLPSELVLSADDQYYFYWISTQGTAITKANSVSTFSSGAAHYLIVRKYKIKK